MEKNYNLFKWFGIAFAVALLLELTVFNFRFYQSLFYKPLDNINLTISTDEIEEMGNYTYRLKSDTVYLEFLDINERVNNFFLDLEIINTDNREKQKIEVIPYYTDEANKLYRETQRRYIVHNVPLSQYINFNTSGASEKIKFEVNAKENDEIQIHNIGVNATRPFNFSVVRLLSVFAFLSLFFVLKSAYVLDYKIAVGLNLQKLMLIAIMLLQILFLLHCITRNPVWDDFVGSWHEQYKELARSMVDNKQLYLQEEQPQFLIDMENPYDTAYRDKLVEENGVGVAWDRAYYNGHYYVYFGIVPVMIMYIPYYMITGNDLSNTTAVFVYMAVFAVFSFALVWEIIKKWFRNIPFIYYIFFSLLMVNCTNMLFVAQAPGIYIVPITVAVAFTVTGLYFWISSLRNNGIVWWRMLLGSLSLALVAGCRPQLLLMSFTAIILFWNTAFKDRLLFSKKGIWNTVCLVLPYVVVAAFIMWYNNARFGSPFDFGASYNLTTDDMTHRGIKLDRVFLGFFYGLFQLPEITTVFPFVKDTHFATNYIGTIYTEANFGGYIGCNIIVGAVFFIGKLKESLKEKGIYVFTLYTIISAFVINIVNTQVGSIVQRYICDYGFLLMLGAIIILLCIIEKTINTSQKVKVYNYIRLGVVLSLVYNLLLINIENSLAINEQNAPLYYNIYHTVQFWL